MTTNLKSFLPFLLVISLAAGCSFGVQPTPIYVTATPDATAGPTATPTLTPTPTFPPTPTVVPEVALRLADRYLVNGYYENAVYTYQTILAQGDGISPATGAAAAFGLGRAALREGLFADSVNALTTFINQYGQDGRIAQAYFLRGDAYMGLSQWAEALADFQQYLAMRPGMIDSYVHERMGDAHLALEQTQPALDAYAKATGEGRSLVPELALREKVAQVYIQAGQPQAALAQYDAILAEARNVPYRALIELNAAQLLLDSGSEENALARLQAIFENYPDTPQAYQAMQLLTENGVELDDYAKGRVSYLYGDYQTAIDAFNAYTSSHILSEVPAELYLLLGRAYREIGNTAAAITAFQTVIDQYPTDPAFGEALLEQGRTRFLSNDIEGAIAQYLRIADTYGDIPQAAEALWRAGYLYGTNDKPAESRQIFERLADKYPDTEQARSGLFLAASAAYNLDDLAGAERLYARLAVTTTGDDQAAAYLWVGRLALQRGDEQTAQQAFQQAVAAAPDSYFAARAQDIQLGREPFAPPAQVQFEFDEAAQLAEAENWLRQKFAVEQEGSLWQLSPPLQADPRLIRGNELWAVGANEEAEVEFGDVIEANKDNALTSFQLAVFLRGIGAYQPSILAGANVIRAAQVGTLEAPPFIARLRYPVYYLDVVLDAAQRQDIDPLLLFSLIRHESLFDTYATAAAGEKGLTQVIPSTGEYIAQQLEWPNYQHSDLFRPYAGVEFGAYFLAENLRRFDNNVIAALAGYNAGPGRAASWLELSGGDPDLFMTTITIASTRTYVERIYGFYNIYRALYGVA
ncbi:MAG: tetratricopeptide repeat protein [Chloroflexi bacterium]|nr:tetratricopeptide repeat protein [Chloroflexota bacterium]